MLLRGDHTPDPLLGQPPQVGPVQEATVKEHPPQAGVVGQIGPRLGDEVPSKQGLMVLDLHDLGGQRELRPGLDQHEQFPAVDRHLDLTHLAPLVRDLALARHLPAALIAGRRL